jgi:hypothetical protein
MDHTIVGPQPAAWDLAGALVEWRLGRAATARFLRAYEEAGGEPVPPESLAFYRLAYAAFRMGECSLLAWLSPDDPDEAARNRRAEEAYRRQVRKILLPADARHATASETFDLQPAVA